MERSTETKATSDGARLNRVQMARALREGAGAEDGRGAEQRMVSVERNWSMDGGLRRAGASVTLGILLASTLTGGRITALRADFLRHAAAGASQGGSIPGSPGPSVGSDGQGHSPIQDTNQEQQKTMFSKLTGVTAAIAVGASVTVAGAQNAAVQWKVEDGGNGHWYQRIVIPGGITWTAARVQATVRGGHLATISTAGENTFVLQSSEVGSWATRYGPWLGGFQTSQAVEPGGGWTWVTEEPWTFTNWDGLEPNNGCSTNPNENALQFINFGTGWNDIPDDGRCDTEGPVVHFMVEWDADCNNDGIVDYGQCRVGTLPDYNGNNIPDCCEQGITCNGTSGLLAGTGNWDNSSCIAIPTDLGSVRDVAGGGYQSLTIMTDGSVRAWGPNIAGEATVPPGLSNVISIAAGLDHSVALKSDGTLECWGSNVDGACDIPAALADVRKVQAGWHNTVALRTDGTVLAWGRGWYGMSAVPVGLSNVRDISTRWCHSTALIADGTVVGWGSNFFGESQTPVGLPAIAGIAAGAYHNVVLTASGQVLAWGAGMPGSSGGENFGQSTVPTDLVDVVEVAAGYDFSVALQRNGTIRKWGLWASTCEPTAPLVGVLRIACGYNHLLAVVTPNPCIGDILVDRIINGADLGALLSYWGPTTSSPVSKSCDLNQDGTVDGSDLGVLLAYWGPCSN